MYLDVLVELSNKHIDHTYTYFSEKEVEVGCRVLVPFGKKELEGFVMRVHNNKPDYNVKDIKEVIDEVPVLNEEMLKLGIFIRSKTLSNLISCYQAMLPKAYRAKYDYDLKEKYVTYIKIIDEKYIPKNERQKQIIASINKGIIKKSELLKISSSLNTLIKNKVVEEYQEEVYRLVDDKNYIDNNIILNDIQKEVISDVSNHLNTYYPALIHGVTGSGKTEIYMSIIDNVLKENKESIVLVPEISLTPQLTEHFRNRFGNNIAILHSRLSAGEKYDEWRKIIKKEVKIVIGARSAIFAPFTNLGVIIIDEEHSNTYKQENNPKYNALDIAMIRAKYHNIPLIFGSATPSLETYTRALSGHINLYELKNRINRNMPKVILVDLKEEIKNNHKVLSRILIEKINDRLDKKEQILILLNRRGYSTTITCHNCGFTDKCPMCDVPLVYHKANNKMQCHYCNYTKNKIDVCPECKSRDINQFGIGTQKLEEYLLNLFPTARIVRMDQDTTSKKNAHETIINDFQNHEYDILIGTQMIAKGLDFPNVTLVGVLNGDAGLSIPDFKSAERTFQLLSQVAGRSGRGILSGEVIIQVYNVEHYSIKKAVENDYLGFYKEELNIRRILKYSPYYNMCLIKLYSVDYEELNKESNKVANYLRGDLKEHTILGPSSPSMPKINNIYSMQIIIKYKNIDEIIESIKFVNSMYIKNKKVNLEIDFNPSKI
jgi:primosomal protein N' (replication factor Y) (superfamily II helicase)